MIPTQDLCIGNWVYDGDRTQFPMFIRAIGEDYVYLDFEGNEGDLFESTPEELQGILLKRNILDQLGFVADGYRYEKFDGDWTITIHPFVPLVRIECELSGTVRATFTSEKIKYLHELQNAFYMTTKQELKINL